MGAKLEMLIRLSRIEEAKNYLATIKSIIPRWHKYKEGIELAYRECLLLHESNEYLLLENAAREGLKECAKWDWYLRFNFENLLGLALLNTGKVNEARDLFKRTIDRVSQRTRLEPALWPIYGNLGRAEILLGKIKDAETNLAKAQRLCEKTGIRQEVMTCCYNVAIVLGLQGKYLEALRLLNNIKEWAEIFDNLLLRVGVYKAEADLHYEIGNIPVAKDLILKVIELSRGFAKLDGERCQAVIRLGLLNAEGGKISTPIFFDAQRDFKGVFIEPHLQLILELDIASAYISAGMFDKVKNKIAHIEDKYKSYLMVYKPQKVRFMIMKGILLQKEKDYDSAILSLKEGIELAKSMEIPILVAWGLFRLGNVLKKLDRLEEAMSIFEEAFNILKVISKNLSSDLRAIFCNSQLWKNISVHLQ